MVIKYDNSLVIHGFAILHAATTMLCLAAGVDDSIFLTVWTMAMTVLLCNIKELSVEFTAISVVLVNILGYVLGMAIAAGFNLLTDIGFLTHAASTFITTEVLGWSIVLLVPGNKREGRDIKDRWLWVAILVVLIARIIIGLLSSSQVFESVQLSEAVAMLVSNSGVLLILICVNVILLHRVHSAGGFKSRRVSLIWHLLLFLVSPAVCVMMMAIGLPTKYEVPFTLPLCLELLILSFIAQVVTYSIIYLIYYVTSTRREMEAERTKSLIAQMEYHNLKQQVNPHFLFNCLNVLDALVAQGKTAEARSFNRKLAQMYRYMLNNENESLIPLSEELEYVNMYTDLLKVRFPSGMFVDTVIADAAKNRYVVKYSVQMLVENAYKHNSISENDPLKIIIKADDDRITVSNNRHPKVSKSESTGLGLKYIRQNYLANGGKDIEIIDTADVHSVSLPLL
ncbi:MAG: histidine kinase [Bacteroidales bacterium]|nr:histidine kinase [Bacteroidales bacterium]